MSDLRRMSIVYAQGSASMPLLFRAPESTAGRAAADVAEAPPVGDFGDWATNVQRFHPAESINQKTRAWLDLAVAWHTVACRKPLYGLFRSGADWLIAVSVLALLAPLLLVIAALVKLTSPGPVLYVQPRVGRGCRVFRIYKFRTMDRDADQRVPFERNRMRGGMFKVTDDPRVVPFGRFLRRWSLDELPQLFNVVRGEMSLIGPRPLSLEDACAVPEELMIRFALRPGVTGLWQALARDSRDGRAKMAMDAHYVAARTAKLDLYLCLKTVGTIVSGAGAD